MKYVILAASFLFLMPRISYAGPEIRFEQVSHDLGMIVPQEAAEDIFEFANTGDAELVIERLGSS